MIKKTVLTTAAACMMSVAVQAGEVPFITLNNGQFFLIIKNL